MGRCVPAWAGMLVSCLVAMPAGAAGPLLPSFSLLTDASWVRHTQGADGLVGTADDVLLTLPGPDGTPGTADDVAANRLGAASSLRFAALPFGGDFESFASGVLAASATSNQTGVFVIGPLDLLATTDTSDGLDGTLTDVDIVTQSIRIEPTGAASALLRLNSCTGGGGSCVEIDVALRGAAVRPGVAPGSIPGVSAALASAIATWIAVLPAGWTQLLALEWPATLLTPLNVSGSVAAFYWSGTGSGMLVAVSSDAGLLDADTDGVPDGLDNCPFAVNPDQLDQGGIGAASTSDGVGDTCQCGDVSGDGRVSTADAVIVQRALLVPPTATMAHPERCDVGGSSGCSTADAIIVRRALLVPATASIAPSCAPAHL